MTTATLNKHITKNASGTPVISGTRFKVIHLIMAAQNFGWDPAELHQQYPHLSPEEIHSALAYYWENREAIDRDIQESLENSERLREELRPYSIKPLLKEKGVI